VEYIYSVLRILQVAFGIGLVIFVHEGGHYLAARLCRVRVDVFSLGFGPRLFGWRRGGTLYQIAVVPFGGYVKMAGEELGGDRDRAPRSDELAAKSPLQRLFIYSGGVMMNVVFALVAFPVALLAGVPSLTPLIGEPAKGSPAWQSRLEPGTKFLSINGTELFDFLDIPNEIALGGARPARIEIERPGSETREFLEITPQYSEREGLYRIGVELGWDPDLRMLVAPGSPAAEAGILENDRLLAVAGQPRALGPARGLMEALALGGPITLQVARGTEEHEFTIAPRPSTVKLVILGLQPGGLVIRAVRSGALAEDLGFEAEDRLLSIGGRLVHTTLEILPALLSASGPIAIEISRAGQTRTLTVPGLDEAGAVALVDDLAIEADFDSPLLSTVPDSAATEAGVLPGDRLLRVDGDDVSSYGAFFERTKSSRERGKSVGLEVSRETPDGGHERKAFTITPRNVPPPDYGLGLRRPEYVWRVPSVPGAIAAGCSSSLRFARSVWLTLRKMGSGEVSSKNMGGIVTIGLVSHTFALEGWPKFFFFLCILSINLAFLNVLPIPVLDGGHLFFVLIEMIKGSPVSERTLGYSQIVGLVLIVSLMVYVTYNDVMRFFIDPG
jgi:regulator of sigma E protease